MHYVVVSLGVKYMKHERIHQEFYFHTITVQSREIYKLLNFWIYTYSISARWAHLGKQICKNRGKLICFVSDVEDGCTCCWLVFFWRMTPIFLSRFCLLGVLLLRAFFSSWPGTQCFTRGISRVPLGWKTHNICCMKHMRRRGARF